MKSASAEAPGRLDFLGGVADYSGSLVLQTPIAATTRVTVSENDGAAVRIESARQVTVEWPLEYLHTLDDAPPWSRYVLGCLRLFCDAMNWKPSQGLHFHIESAVPVSMGVSSSAALEVATLRALENLTGKRFSGTELAKLAQRAENEIVGAPCGLMDQLASAYGQAQALLPIVCRPDILRDPIRLPEDVLIVGWPSGVKHAVSDSPYATARCAAFMGKKILETHFNRAIDYLTELTPSQVQSVDEHILPLQISGAKFLEAFGGVDDPLSKVEPERRYSVRAGTLFPVEENFRCELASHLLATISQENRHHVLGAIGEMMYQSHAGYSSIGLGCPETDAMVEAIRARGAESGFYGARVSGGGSGGTVVVLLSRAALPVLRELAQPAVLIEQ